MATYFADAFTGSDGASWNSTNWTTSSVSGLNTAGSTATIQTNKGRLDTGSVASYGGHMAIRYNGATQADHEWIGKITFNDTIDGNFESWIRAGTSAVDGTGYVLQFAVGSSSNVKIIRAVSYVYTTIATGSVTITSATEIGWRHYSVGTSQKAKVWTGSEPGTYTLSVTDSSVTAAGYAYVHAHGGGSAGFDVDLDDVSLTDGTGNVVATFTSSVTSTGTFRRNQVNKGFTGSITSSGVFSYLKVVQRIFTSSITATGVLAKKAIKTFTGSVTGTGTAVKRANKTFTGSVTGIGAYSKSFVRTFTGSIAATGAATITFIGRIFGRPGRVKIVPVKAGEVRLRIRRG